jgi:origin recognition complex subunit 2
MITFMSGKRKRVPTRSAQSTPSKRTRAEVLGNDDVHSYPLDELAQTNGTGTSSKTKARSRVISTAKSPAPKVNGTATPKKSSLAQTPKSKRKAGVFDTPSKVRFEDKNEAKTPKSARNGDHSARKKATARVLERSLAATGSDDEASNDDDELGRQILSDEEEDGASQERGDEARSGAEPEIPLKRSRGRPKGAKNRRSPTPPLADLPAHEVFFWQNRPGAGKTSNNTLSSHLLLNHDEYFTHRKSYKDPHQEERDFLLELHKSAFPQWLFELQEGFNICLYGYGSKREAIQALAGHIYNEQDKPPKIIIVNGYNTSLSLRDMLTTIASTIFPKNVKLPMQPSALQQLILETLTDKPQPLFLLINSIDAATLRRPTIQAALASLASHPEIHLVATADTPNFALLWDISLRQQFRFVFHDCTTFTPFDAAEIDIVESVNELLGRSGRRIGGRDGVGYVLKSLPENARNLYRILVAEQLAASIDSEDHHHLALGEESAGEDMDAATNTTAGAARRDTNDAGVEYRVLYHKAREELVCSTEHQFRTLLKEFYDHQMVESRRDGLGTERLVVPFRKEDLEGLLEELVE